MGPGESAAHDAFHDEVVGGMSGSDADSEVEFPLWTEIHVDGGEELLLLVSECVEAGI